MKKSVIIFCLILTISNCFARFRYAKYRETFMYGFSQKKLNEIEISTGCSDEDKIRKMAEIYCVQDSVFSEIYNNSKYDGLFREKEIDFVDRAYLYEQFIYDVKGSRGLDYYLQYKDFYHLKKIIFFQKEPVAFDSTDSIYYEKVSFGENYPYETLWADTLLFTFVGQDSILFDISFGKNKYFHSGFKYEVFKYLLNQLDNNDKPIIRRTKVINDTLFVKSYSHSWEPLFIKSDKPIEYKNSRGTFFHTGMQKEVKFFDQVYTNFYQVFWGEAIIWFDENFEILRIGDFGNNEFISFDEHGVGYYRVYNSQDKERESERIKPIRSGINEE